jgi:hypothetical protein
MLASKDKLMWRLTKSALLLGTGLLAGYYISLLRQPDFGAAATRIPSDYYTNAKSFSEVENATAVVQGLADQFLDDWRHRRVVDLRRHSTQGRTGAEPAEMLRRGLEEFGNTPAKDKIEKELLRFLRQSGEQNEFLDEYLKMAYLHPGYASVAAFSEAALSAAQSTGREYEYAEVVRHRAAIPEQFLEGNFFGPATSMETLSFH